MLNIFQRFKDYTHRRDLFVKKDNLKTYNGNIELNYTKLIMLFALSAIFYSAFVLLSKTIHHIRTNPDLTDVSAWLLGFAQENDGIELYVMTFAMPIYILSSYIIINYLKINFSFLSKKSISIVCLLPVLVLVILNLIFKEPLTSMTLVLFVSVIIISCLIIFLSNFRFSIYTKISVYISLFIFFTLICLLVSMDPSIFNYSYYIGPANKILNGEKLGTFYIQYNIIGTFLFAAMQKCNLLIHEMQIVLSILFAVWMLLYAKAALLIFKNRSMVGLFLLSLLIVRCLSIWGGPVATPQVSPIRMDLWVPLLIVVLYFGFQSVITALAFSVCYLADDVFGFMYLALYVVILLYHFCHEWYNEKRIRLRIEDIMLLVLPIISYSVHFIVFGSFSSLAGNVYSNFHFGFMPISEYSSFWLIAWALPICLYFLCQNKQNRILYLFILGLACIQLTYFFGRSHEHNLRNISGITIFIFFLTIDTIYSLSSKKKIILCATVIFVGGIVVNFNSTVIEKVALAASKIKNKTLIDSSPIEKQIALKGEYLKAFDPQKILVLCDIDSYIIYRLGYNQIGYFSPFYANFSTKKTIVFLKDRINNGYRLIVFPPTIVLAFTPDFFNNDPILVKNKERFVLEALNENLFEMKLVHY